MFYKLPIFPLTSLIELYHVEISISVWRMRKVGIQQGYAPDPKSQSQLVPISTPHPLPGALHGAPQDTPLLLAAEPGQVSLAPPESPQERAKQLSST